MKTNGKCKFHFIEIAEENGKCMDAINFIVAEKCSCCDAKKDVWNPKCISCPLFGRNSTDTKDIRNALEQKGYPIIY